MSPSTISNTAQPPLTLKNIGNSGYSKLVAGCTAFIPKDKNQSTAYNYVVSGLLVQNQKLKASAPNIYKVTFKKVYTHLGKTDTNAQFIKKSKLKVPGHVMGKHLLELGERIYLGCSWTKLILGCPLKSAGIHTCLVTPSISSVKPANNGCSNKLLLLCNVIIT